MDDGRPILTSRAMWVRAKFPGAAPPHGEESSMRVLCRLPEPVLASTLLAAARTHMVCVSYVSA